jgi:hypothetical protein
VRIKVPSNEPIEIEFVDTLGRTVVLHGVSFVGAAAHKSSRGELHFKYGRAEISEPTMSNGPQWKEPPGGYGFQELLELLRRAGVRPGVHHDPFAYDPFRDPFAGDRARSAQRKPADDFDWRVELDHPYTLAEAEAMYRHLAKKAHPDVGGSNEAMARLNRAIAEARLVLV